MRRRTVLLALTLCAAGLGLVQGCDVGNPPVRTGVSLLEFGQGDVATTTTYLQYYPGSPFFHWAWREGALRNATYTDADGAATTTFVWDLTQQPLVEGYHNFVRYRSVHAYWHHRREPAERDLATQHEVILFARDPEEMFETFAAIRPYSVPQPLPLPPLNVTLNDAWRDEYVATRVPDGATFLYPPEADWNTNRPDEIPSGPAEVTYFPVYQDFWDGVTPDGAGSYPDVYGERRGSVKAAHLINHGICSQLARYADRPGKQGIFSQIPAQFFKAVAAKVGELAKDAEPDVRVSLTASNVTSYIRTTTEREDAQHGGFFFNFGAAFTDLPAFSGPSAYAVMNHVYEFKLLDGRLTVDPLHDVSLASGDSWFGAIDDFVGTTVQQTLEAALLTSLTTAPTEYNVPDTLAGKLFHAADIIQETAGVQSAPGLGCTPRGPGDETIEVSPNPTDLEKPCGAFFSAIRSTLFSTTHGGLAETMLDVPPDAFNQLWSTVLTTKPNPYGAGAVYKYARCVPRGSVGGNYCRLSVPARRINALPDGVELVFVDDNREFNNVAYAAYLVAFELDRLSDLCDPPVKSDGRLSRRPFYNYTRDNKTYAPANCQHLFFPERWKCDGIEQ